MRRERLATWAGLALLALALVPFMRSGVLNNDEFTTLANAQRVLAGEVPYRDFFEYLPPFNVLLVALALKLGGNTLAASHTLAALMLGGAAWAMRVAARRLGLGPVGSWLPAFILVYGLYAYLPCWNYHWAVLTFDLGALALALVGLGRPGIAPWLGAGLMVGLAGFTVQTDGAAIGLALGAGVVLDAWRRQAPWRELATRLGGLAAGTAAVAAVVVAGLAATGALGAAVADVVVWPATQYRQHGGINDVRFGSDLPAALLPLTPLPGWYVRVYLILAMFALIPGAALAAVVWLGDRLRPRAAWEPRHAGLAMVAVWSVLALYTVLRTGRSDLVHVAHYGAPSVLFLCVAADRLRRLAPAPGLVALRWLPTALLVAYLGAAGLAFARAVQKMPDRWLHPRDPDAAIATSPVITYLRAHLRPGDRIAAMPYAGYFYFYGAPPASRWTLMLPPDQGYGSPDEFKAFWAEIAARRPRFIVIAPWAWKPFELAVADYAAHLPPGYRRVGAFGSPQYNYVFPAVVYEAVP